MLPVKLSNHYYQLLPLLTISLLSSTISGAKIRNKPKEILEKQEGHVFNLSSSSNVLKENKIYIAANRLHQIDPHSLSSFLYSSNGFNFLKRKLNKSNTFPLQHKNNIEELRTSIIADSIDGTISTIGIIKNLPEVFRREVDCYSNKNCKLLPDWYLSLPACLQSASESYPYTTKNFIKYCL